MAFLFFGSNQTSASALHKTRECKFVFALAFLLATIGHDLLHFVKQGFGNNWLVTSFVHFARKGENAVINGFLEHTLDTGHREDVVMVAPQSFVFQKLCECFQCIVACGIEFKRFGHKRCFFFVQVQLPRSVVVEVTNRCPVRPNALPELCTVSSSNVLRQIIDVVLALAERNGKHKFPLWRGIKPKRGKLQIFEVSCVQQIHDFSSVYRIASKTIRVPSQNSFGFAVFNPFEHFGERSSPRFFGSFGLVKRGNDCKFFFGGKFPQFLELGFNTQHLFFFGVRAFSGVEKIPHIFVLKNPEKSSLLASALRAGKANSSISRLRWATGHSSKINLLSIGGVCSKKSEPASRAAAAQIRAASRRPTCAERGRSAARLFQNCQRTCENDRLELSFRPKANFLLGYS